MLPESQSAVVARNETWRGEAATEPYEAGWAREAVIFVRALDVVGPAGVAHVELSPVGMNWVAEGTSFVLPASRDEVSFARIREFGNWLRLTVLMPEHSAVTVVVTIHLKA
jgi:hypothetical protein